MVERLLVMVVPCFFIGLVGCGTPMGKVTGKVTANGNPVPNATVSFEDEVKHVRSSGVTDANGGYTLSTNAKDDGAPAGKYKVAVVQAGKSDSGDLAVPPRLFPATFERIETSTLSFEVKSGKNVYDIQLPGP